MIFQAMGARYTLSSALRHMVTQGDADDHSRLMELLKSRYGGEVTLYRKGRAALAAAVQLLSDRGDVVVVSGLTCYSLVQAVEEAGSRPVYADINDTDLHFSAKELSRSITRSKGNKVSAIVVQNMLGIPADITEIERIAKKHNIKIIEDLAHSVGAHYSDGREVGTVGDLVVLSFGKDKAVDSVNGGALVVRTVDKRVTPPSKQPRFIDQLRDRIYPFVAWSARRLYPIGVGKYVMGLAIRASLVVRSADGGIDTSEGLPFWQARIALREMLRIDTVVNSRREKGALYREMIKGTLPVGVHRQGASPIRVPMLVQNRAEVVSALLAEGIQANDIWYDSPVSPVRFYSGVNYPEDHCPVAVRVASEIINLPTHERVSVGDVGRVVAVVNGVAKQ